MSECHDCLYLALQIKSPPVSYTQASRQSHRFWINFDKTRLQMFFYFFSVANRPMKFWSANEFLVDQCLLDYLGAALGETPWKHTDVIIMKCAIIRSCSAGFLSETLSGSSLRRSCFALWEWPTAENWRTTAVAIMRLLSVKGASIRAQALTSARALLNLSGLLLIFCYFKYSFEGLNIPQNAPNSVCTSHLAKNLIIQLDWVWVGPGDSIVPPIGITDINLPNSGCIMTRHTKWSIDQNPQFHASYFNEVLLQI